MTENLIDFGPNPPAGVVVASPAQRASFRAAIAAAAADALAGKADTLHSHTEIGTTGNLLRVQHDGVYYKGTRIVDAEGRVILKPPAEIAQTGLTEMSDEHEDAYLAFTGTGDKEYRVTAVNAWRVGSVVTIYNLGGGELMITAPSITDNLVLPPASGWEVLAPYTMAQLLKFKTAGGVTTWHLF
jgi:hypothetical protein